MRTGTDDLMRRRVEAGISRVVRGVVSVVVAHLCV